MSGAGVSLASALTTGAKALGSSMTGETVKGMLDADFIKDTVGQGLKSAFSEAGGGRALAGRMLKGAAVGGVASGTVSAMRGQDFWEGSKKGAVAGAGYGAFKHAGAMNSSSQGEALRENISSKYSTSKAAAAERTAAREVSDWGYRPSGNKNTWNNHGGNTWKNTQAGHYKGKSFWDNMKSDIGTAASSVKDSASSSQIYAVNDAYLANKRLAPTIGKSDVKYSPNSISKRDYNQSRMSEQVKTLMVGEAGKKMSDAVVKGMR